MGGGSRGKRPSYAASRIGSDGRPFSQLRTLSTYVKPQALTRSERDKLIQSMASTTNPNEMGVAFLEAGQGDCTVIKLPNGEVMVIDCNTENANVNVVEFLKKCGVKRIDYLIITHPHYDHMSGLNEISQNFEVKEIWRSDFEQDRTKVSEETYQKYLEYKNTIDKLKEKGTIENTPTAKSEPYKNIGDAEVYCYGPSGSPSESTEEDIHASSMVIKVKFGGSSALFVGDLNDKGWERLNTYYESDLKSKIFHASHHGSTEGCNEEAVRKIAPEHTIVSVGENRFGHPDSEAGKIYKKHTKNSVRYTDEGTIGYRLNSKGECVVIQAETTEE